MLKYALILFYVILIFYDRGEIVKHFRTFLTALGFIALFYFITPNRLFGYLDAGTGSYMVQIIIAFAAGGAFAIKIFWRRIYGFMKRNSSKNKKDEQEKI